MHVGQRQHGLTRIKIADLQMLTNKRVVHPHGFEISALRQAAVKAKKAYNTAKGIMGLEVLQLMPCKESTSFETTVPDASYEVLYWYSIAQAQTIEDDDDDYWRLMFYFTLLKTTM